MYVAIKPPSKINTYSAPRHITAAAGSSSFPPNEAIVPAAFSPKNKKPNSAPKANIRKMMTNQIWTRPIGCRFIALIIYSPLLKLRWEYFLRDSSCRCMISGGTGWSAGLIGRATCTIDGDGAGWGGCAYKGLPYWSYAIGCE